ncbi:MAG: hypothetical protein FWG75_01055 [Cystobacterineae bacterium]|nr:hypothetical protein [Cystobacterineae bacterium]
MHGWTPQQEMDDIPTPSTTTPSKKTWSLGKPPKTSLPKPRGRFVQISPCKENLRVLLHPEAKERLLLFIQSSTSQAELLSCFSSQFRGNGEMLRWKEVASVLKHHGFLAAFEDKERAALCAGLLQHRCSLDKLSKALNTKPGALKKRIAELSLQAEFDKLRKRFGAEILDSTNINRQLRALARPGYLRDLNISFALKKQLSLKLKTSLAQLPPELETPEMQLGELAKKLKLDKKLLSLTAQQLKIF